MPHRDPETGQFKAGHADDATTAWDDLRTVHVQQTARHQNATDSGGSFRTNQLPEIDLQRTDTLSLSRDEAAELVAIEIRNHRAYVDDNDFTNNENFRAGMVLGINYAPVDWIQDNDLVAPETGDTDAIGGRTRIDDDSRILWRGARTYQTSGGSSIKVHGDDQAQLLHYRNLFGGGPLLDDDDSLAHGAWFNTVATAGNGNLVQVLDWDAHFDIFEVERSISRVR